MAQNVVIARFGAGQLVNFGLNAAGMGAIVTPTVAEIIAPVTLSMGVSWSNHVVANGGAAPSATAQTAVSVFWTRLVNDGIAPLIYNCNVFTDSITASATPITSSTNQWLWTTVGFVSTDLDKNGIYASASSKYFDTLMTCAGTLTSSNDVGISYYLYSADDTTSQNDWAILGTNRIANTYASGSTCYFDVWAVTGGRISGTGGHGFVCYNRTSNTNASASFYHSNSPNGTAIATSTGLSQGTMPTGNMYVYRMNTDGNARNTHKMSYWSIHRGMTAAQTKLYYDAVQQLRIDLGGGYR